MITDLEYWGQHMVEKYIDEIFEHFEEITAKPTSSPVTYKFVKDCRKSIFKNNAIYFSLDDGSVEILAILRHQDIS